MGLKVCADGELGDNYSPEAMIALCYIEVSVCETFNDLGTAIQIIAGIYNGNIPGRSKDVPVEEVLKAIELVRKGEADFRVLTRNFGIRQQAIYLRHYGEK